MKIGFNRRLNDQPNTINASRKAVKSIKNLYSIELGNEPDCMWKNTRYLFSVADKQ